MSDSTATETTPQPKWHPLSAQERRVAGALVEKAKTTPESYPLTVNSLRNACNQKSNRAPLMSLEDTQVEDALERLRATGVVVEIQGDGRVPKYRHLMYEWLGVDKVEMAVMTELLLRGAQTVGELRGRAARMEPISDLPALWPILESLEKKGLITFLTPRGRGCAVTHALYLPNEMDKVRRQFSDGAAATHTSGGSATDDDEDDSFAPRSSPSQVSRPTPAAAGQAPSGTQQELADLRDELSACQSELDDLRTQFSTLQADVERIRTELGI